MTEADKRTETLDQRQRAALVTVQQVQWHQCIALVPYVPSVTTSTQWPTWAPLQAMGYVIGKEL